MIQEMIMPFLAELIQETNQAICDAPSGRLRIAKSNGCEQYYKVTEPDDFNGTYIKKCNMDLVKALAQKEYDKRVLQDLIQLRDCCKRAEEIFGRKNWLNDQGEFLTERLETRYENLGEARKKLVEPRVLSDEEYLKRWEAVNYRGKEFADDIPEIYTEKGERVRSKSEKMIADKLFLMGIPYRYEYPLYIQGFGTVYPDFTLLHIRRRKEVRLEHFGMMDHPEYALSAVKKINLYQTNQICIGDGLLVSFETSTCPIDMRSLGKMLECFLKD